MALATTFRVGGLCDDPEWQIRYDLYGGTSSPCPHAVDIKANPRHPEYLRWTVPRVVVAGTEELFNSSGVCLDCILDAAAQLADHGQGDVA